MKYKKTLLTTLITFALLSWSTSYADHHGNDADHDHSAHAKAMPEEDHSDHDHKAHEDDHDEHDHGEVKAGPNGGRIITSVEPHIEFFVTDTRLIQITFLNDDGKAVAPKDQALSLIGGDRQNPVRLRFTKKGNVLVSDNALPEGNNLPIVLSIKADAKSKTIREKFNLNLSDCPTCEYKEYACICEHGEESHEGHDH